MKFHPLFTIESDLSDPEQAKEAEIDVGYINVQRLQGGHYVSAGRLFEASEIDSLERFIAEFGGGQFQLYGRGPDNRGVVRRATLRIDEHQYPPRFAPVSGMPAPAAGAGNLPAPPPAAGGFGLNSGLLELITVLKALQPAPAPPQDNTVLVALIQNQGAQAVAQASAIAQQAAGTQAQFVELVKALQHSPTGGDNPAAIQDSFMNGIRSMGQILKEMKEGGEGDKPFNLDTLLSIADRVMSSIGQAHAIIKDVNAGVEAPAAAGSAVAELAAGTDGAHTAAAAA
jgi:hypothetical protein